MFLTCTPFPLSQNCLPVEIQNFGQVGRHRVGSPCIYSNMITLKCFVWKKYNISPIIRRLEIGHMFRTSGDSLRCPLQKNEFIEWVFQHIFFRQPFTPKMYIFHLTAVNSWLSPFSPRRYMTEILPIRRKILSNQSINHLKYRSTRPMDKNQSGSGYFPQRKSDNSWVG